MEMSFKASLKKTLVSSSAERERGEKLKRETKKKERGGGHTVQGDGLLQVSLLGALAHLFDEKHDPGGLGGHFCRPDPVQEPIFYWEV